MKILVVQDYLRSGGTERQSVLLANAFAAAGHATTLLTFRPGGPLRSTITTPVRQVVLQPLDFKLDWFAPGLFHRLEQTGPDIALCMGRLANCYGGAIERVIRRVRPTAATVCTMRTGKKLPRRFVRSLHTVPLIVANSWDARDTLVDTHSVDPEKISVIYNSLVFPPIVPLGGATPSSRNSLRAQYAAAPTTTVLLCVAMFRPEKNQRELIEIAAGLPARADWQLWLAGDGPARANSERLVDEKNVGARVKFLGLQRDPSPLYAAVDIAVHASASESLSNFLIEAQAHGLPAVAYEAQGIHECFIPNRTGWTIVRDDRAAFRDRILHLASDSPAIRAERSTAARSFARATFDPARQTTAYLDLFARLCS